MDSLTGKVALVTGADRGIGRGIAEALALAGADIAVNYRVQKGAAQETWEQIGKHRRRGIVVQADVSHAADVARLVETTQSQLGTIEILVNNAGIGQHRSIEEIREEDWDETIDVNLKSVFLVTQAVLPGMRARHWGRIINISSVGAQVGSFVGPHYAASKAGMIGLTHAYAAMLAEEGITVNAIAPALISTDMITHNPSITPEMLPVGRFGTVDEVADVAVMLARNGYITGQTINVNGGRYMS